MKDARSVDKLVVSARKGSSLIFTAAIDDFKGGGQVLPEIVDHGLVDLNVIGEVRTDLAEPGVHLIKLAELS